MQVNHSTHPHPLFLSEDSNRKGFCLICQETIVGNPCYVCEDCRVYVHKQCVELPSVIDHPFHPQHPLELSQGVRFCCDSCHKKFEEKPRFRCNTCDFDLDVKCALMSKINQEGEEFIQHFSHQHPMSLCCQDHNKFLTCFACKKITSEVVYGCNSCEYFLHKSCSELPTPILHTLHPIHRLHLRIKYGLCQICKVDDCTFKFSCDDCNYSLDLTCWMDYTEGENLDNNCFICSKQHKDSSSCVDSKYLLNQTCIWLPNEINHQFHSHNPLQFLARDDFQCDSCHQCFYKNSCYGCHECRFYMDVKCSLMPSVGYNEGDKYLDSSILFYFSHQHPLCLITQDLGIICFVCQMTRPFPIYGCPQCEYFLHQSCFELPNEIENPIHRHRKLHIEHLPYRRCDLCMRKYSGFFFKCVYCTFSIGIECYSLIPNVHYEYHDHPLCLVEKAYSVKCDDTFCAISKFSSEFEHTKTYSLRCADCYFGIHLLCGPLPCIITDKNHLHCLKLTESVVEDDSDEYYCDICEEERDPRICVYYCKDCDFVSHVHCVMSEILSAFKKDSPPVEMRIARDLRLVERKCQPCYDARGNVLCLKDVLDSLSAYRRNQIECHFTSIKFYQGNKDNIKTKDESGLTSKYQGSDIIRELSMHSDGTIFNSRKERVKQFRGYEKYLMEPYEHELKVVEVEGYMITSNYASLLGALFMKYGDFSAPARFEKNFKSVIFYLFCRTVNAMRRTCLADSTERQHDTWAYYCAGVRDLGFHVDFIVPFLEKSLKSFISLRAIKLEQDMPEQVAQEIADLEENISQIKSQIECRKNYLLQFKPGNDQWRDYARKNKWRRVGEDII